MLMSKHPAFEKPIRTSFPCAREDAAVMGMRRKMVWGQRVMLHQGDLYLRAWRIGECLNDLEHWERVRHRQKGLHGSCWKVPMNSSTRIITRSTNFLMFFMPLPVQIIRWNKLMSTSSKTYNSTELSALFLYISYLSQFVAHLFTA